jgi:nucleoredoxin
LGVSSDRDQQAQFNYMKTYGMQWPAVPFGPETARLGGQYQVQGIPTLVILAPDGRTLTATGRADVQTDPAGAIAKWQAAAGQG